MEYKKINCESYNIHTIATDKFKTTRMEIIFSMPVDKERMQEFTFLSDLLSDCSKDFKTRKDMSIRLEELYKTIFYANTNKVGNLFTITFVLEFIDPEYINDDNYFENVMSFPFKVLSRPLVKNKEFDLTNFTIIKNRVIEEIKSVKENAVKLAISNALLKMDSNSPTACKVLGSLESLDDITPSSLYDTYTELFNHANCDIFLIGNIDMNRAVKIIKENFKCHVIKLSKTNILVPNKVRSKPLVVEEEANFIQSSLVMIYNIKDLDMDFKNGPFHVFNYLLGTGGLNSILYHKLRIDNSLCYGVKSLYLKYDSLLIIQVSLDQKNVSKAESLIKKSIKDVANGNFSDENVNDAIKNLTFSLKLGNDNNVSIVSNYVFNYYCDLPLVEERIKRMQKVTKNEIMECAKHLKLNTVYIQTPSNGGKNEGN